MARNLKWSIRAGAAFFLFGSVLSPEWGAAQGPQIVSNQVTVSRDEASLRLELASGEEISAEISDGEMRLNGEPVGRYVPGDEFEGAWRALLAEAISSSPDRLPTLIRGWTLPESLGAGARSGAETIKAGLSGPLFPSSQDLAAPPLEVSIRGRTAFDALVRESDRLRELAAVIDDMAGNDLSTYVAEDIVVAAGETLDGPLLLIDGTLQVDGTVEGDVILFGGRLAIGDEGRIAGAVRTSDAEISGDRTQIEGGVIASMVVAEAPVSATVRDLGEVAREVEEVSRDVEEVVREAVREATADAQRNTGDGVFGSRGSPFRSLTRGITGLFRTLVTFGITFAAGLALLYFFPRQLEVVSQASRRVTGRSFLVGLAGLVVAVPLWVVGAVLLTISIIGIPLLIVWIPAVPLALAAAMAFGYVAVARNLGGWLARHDRSPIGGLDATRPAVQIGGGLVLLLAAYALANVFEMAGPLFGVFGGLFLFVAISATMAAISVGLGAVILSRAGQSPDFTRRPWRQSASDPTTGTRDASAES